MSDFSQHGLITTLQRLTENNAPQLEAELEKLARETPIALVLPCHARELGQPALEHLLDEISGAKFLREVVVSMNGPDQQSVKQAKNTFSRLPHSHRILWNDSPAVVQSRRDGQKPPLQGKGRNVWTAFGLLIDEARCGIVATLDCDVTSFRREMLVRLCYACAHPTLNFDFAKMYYSRVTDRIHGRVSRLFVAPLLQALIRVSGHQPLVDFLASFRYPLAGECALRLDLAAALPLDAGWGLEIAMLCETFRHTSPQRICQVDGGVNYEHRHRLLGNGANGGLFPMCEQIANTLLGQLAGEGFAICEKFLGAVRQSFQRAASEALSRYQNLAIINGLAFDAGEEAEAVALFARALETAAREFLAGPPGSSLPAWNSVHTANPKSARAFLQRLLI